MYLCLGQSPPHPLAFFWLLVCVYFRSWFVHGDCFEKSKTKRWGSLCHSSQMGAPARPSPCSVSYRWSHSDHISKRLHLRDNRSHCRTTALLRYLCPFRGHKQNGDRQTPDKKTLCHSPFLMTYTSRLGSGPQPLHCELVMSLGL